MSFQLNLNNRYHHVSQWVEIRLHRSLRARRPLRNANDHGDDNPWDTADNVPFEVRQSIQRHVACGYDDRMKRITVSLPDDLVERIKRAAGGEGQVSSYVATALADYQEREGLEEVLQAWRSETPIADDVLRQVSAELDAVGLAKSSTRSSRQAG